MPAPDTTILIVEDEPLLLMSVADDLRDAGFHVIEAKNADDALEHLRAFPTIDLVFTDVDMPGSMDGIALSKIIGQRWPQTELIITSGKHPKSDLDIPEEVFFLDKPYTSKQVIKAIAKTSGRERN